MTTADEIATLVAAYLNTVATSIVCQAENPPLVPEANRVASDATLLVYPWEESEESFDRGDGRLCVRVVNVWLQCPMTTVLTRAGGLNWLNEIKDAFVELTVEAEDETVWRWRKNTTLTLYDTDAMKEKAQFLSLFRSEFYLFA